MNMAEIEFRVLARACVLERNTAAAPINWRFTINSARAKLRRLYPDTSTLTDW